MIRESKTRTFVKALFLSLWMAVLLVLTIDLATAQRIKDFHWLDTDGAEIPLFVRGNLDSKTIILFVQGGSASKAIDFARSDYPRWKKTLEKELAIAYYDKRGLNQKPSSIDSSKITFDQYAKDVLAIAAELKDRYGAKIVVMGHSYGAMQTLHMLGNHPTQNVIDAAILLSPPLTTDYQSELGNEYRLAYLKNLAEEKIQAEWNIDYWTEALNWATSTDSLNTIERMRTWNKYVDSSFEPAKRRFGPHTYIRVAFSRPYYLFEFFRNGDEKLVSDLIWMDSKNIDLFASAKSVQIPTLAITGRYDDIAPPEEITELPKLNANISINIIPDAGHEPFLDQGEVFRKTVMEFIQGLK